jgi:hypothetical protein
MSHLETGLMRDILRVGLTIVGILMAVSGIIAIILGIFGVSILLFGGTIFFFIGVALIAGGTQIRKPRTAPIYLCPSCGQPLTYIAQYQRWYCYNEQIYV